MKKIKSTYFISLFLLLFVTTGCSDWLTLKPTDGVPRQEYWNTKEDVASFMTGIYSSMVSSDVVTKMFLWGEWRADMVTYSPRRIDYNIFLAMQGEISAENKYCSWASFYKTINQCNTLLQFAKEAQKNDPSFTPKMLKEYESQAIVVRSLMYFYLVKTFGDVPFIREAYIDNSQNMSIPKSSKEQIINELIIDLNAAMENAPIKYSSNDPALNKGQVTLWMAKTLLADIYLWNEEYDKCNELCSQVINSGQFALVPVSRTEVLLSGLTPADNDTVYYANETQANDLFTKMYVDGNCVESIFELQYTDQIYNPLYYLLSQNAGTIVSKVDVLSDEFFISSHKDRGYVDIRDGMAQNKSYVWKYMGKGKTNPVERLSTEMTNNFIVYRLADVYLMKAEALNQMGIKNSNQDLLKEAYDALKVIRTRANATDGTDLLAKASNIDGKILEKFILQERAREFCYEGKRWYDVLRNAKRNDYQNLDYLMQMALLSAPTDKVLSLQNKYKNRLSHYLPIAASELSTNPKLVQNEFYRVGN